MQETSARLSFAYRLKTFGTGPADRKRMTDVALSILALIAGGLSLELFRPAVPPAPDLARFPLDLPDALEECQAGNPS